MTITTPRLNRVPVAERGITIGDFLIPIQLGERISSRVRDFALIVAGALLIALTAQLTIVAKGQTIPLIADFSLRLGSTPVPITGQTFGVLLVGASLGLRRGLLSSGLYLALGLFLPVYAGATHGIDKFATVKDGAFVLGTTGGYLVGFLVAAGVAGKLAELGWDRRLGGALAAMLIGNVVIYVFGLPWLLVATGASVAQVVAWGLTPFILGDAIKLALAAGVFPAAWWVVGRRTWER